MGMTEGKPGGPKAAYPACREADVVLRDGSTVHVRPVRPEDRGALLEFLKGLSLKSRAFRFFSGGVDLEGEASRFSAVDYHDKYGLVATAGEEGRIVGHGLYDRMGPDRAEVAFAVADDLQGRGLGTILLAHLAETAHDAGIRTFEAEVLPWNHQIIEMFRESGFPLKTGSEPGAIRVELPTSLSPEALELFERREQIAAVAALRTFLAPSSVAVIGASRSRGTIGGEIFHNLLTTGFNGPVHPVNPKASVVQSVVAYPSVLDVPGPVDLAIIVVPAAAVSEVVRGCARKGVRALVVISSGFAEAGPEGNERQRELLKVCRSSGMRLIGPNCMGILNTSPDVRLNATFAPTYPPTGRVGFLSQSGALGLAVIDYAKSLGLGLSSFVSVGNKADISGNDLLQYWEADEATEVMVLYLESFGNPRKFSRIARRVGRAKPIIAVKSGRSAAGVRATASHTGALIAASDVTVDALFKQAGVIRTDTLHDMFDVVSLMANQPAPEGRRVAIITNAGGPGILCADACEAEGLEVVPLPEAVRRRLAEFLPPEASLGNPVDMIASASPEDYRRAIRIVAGSEAVDALVVIFIPPLVTISGEVAQAIRTAAGELPRSLPLLTVFMSARGIPEELRGEGLRIPSYAFPEDAARALARAVDYGVWRRTPEGTIPELRGLRADEAAGLIAAALADGPRWLSPQEVARLLSCYGLPMAEWRLARTPEEAGQVAEELGGPVALKAVAPTLVHKTEAHGVRLSLNGAQKVAEAAEIIARDVSQAGHRVEGFLVQRMVPPGVEMLVGVTHDRLFGPVVACGAGGTGVELLKDIAVRIAPLTDRDASEMVQSLATFPLLEGYRGAPKADVPAVEEILLRVSAMVEAHPEVAEMDCNPVIVLPRGATIVDARVRVEVPAPKLPLAARTPPPRG
jgi:acetyl coenzyme A synthetase (ADP forming)-like protein